MHMLLAAGIPVAVLACYISYVQRRAALKPPKDPAEAARRQTWAAIFPYPQLGFHVRLDGFAYSNLTGRCLGQAAGAKAELAAATTVTRARPATGWAVIYFADGTHYRHPFALRNMPEAQAQAARFNAQHAKGGAAGVFRRTCTPAGTP